MALTTTVLPAPPAPARAPRSAGGGSPHLGPTNSVVDADGTVVCDTVVVDLLRHGILAATTRLCDLAERAGDRTMLEEEPFRALLANRRRRWRTTVNDAMQLRWYELGFTTECPVVFDHFGDARSTKEQDLRPDDLEMHWHVGERCEVTWVNHKLERKKSTGLSRGAAGTSFFGAATGTFVATRDAAIADVVAESVGQPRVRAALMLVLTADDDVSRANPVLVCCYDPVLVLAYHRGECTPVPAATPDEWGTTDGRRVVGLHLPEAWLVQFNHRAAEALHVELVPWLVANQVGTATTVTLALNRFTQMALARAEEELRRLDELDDASCAVLGDQRHECDRVAALLAARDA